MKDFQKHDRFKNLSGVEGLIKEAMEKDKDDANKYKVKADFIELVKKENAEATDLAKMFTLLDAEKIIKLIKLYKFEKVEKEEEKKKIRRAYSWARSKKVAGKFVAEDGDYPEISEEDKKVGGDFTKFLYELATGQKSLSSISKPIEQEDNGNPTPNQKGY